MSIARRKQRAGAQRGRAPRPVRGIASRIGWLCAAHGRPSGRRRCRQRIRARLSRRRPQDLFQICLQVGQQPLVFLDHRAHPQEPMNGAVVSVSHHTGTPASESRSAYCSASSRSGSNSAVTMIAGGRSPRSCARSGLTSGLSWLAPCGTYCCQYQRMSAVVSPYPSAFSVADGVCILESVGGYRSIWKAACRFPRSRAARQTAAARLPPALSPPTPIWPGRTLRPGAWRWAAKARQLFSHDPASWPPAYPPGPGSTSRSAAFDAVQYRRRCADQDAMVGPDNDLSRRSDAEQGGHLLDPPRRGAGCVSVGNRAQQRSTVPAEAGRHPAPTGNLDKQRGPWLQARRGQVAARKDRDVRTERLQPRRRSEEQDSIAGGVRGRFRANGAPTPAA
jgi:hypothetical protein